MDVPNTNGVQLIVVQARHALTSAQLRIVHPLPPQDQPPQVHSIKLAIGFFV